MHVYGVNGVSLPRTASSQYASGHAVSRSELRPGDMVFFYDPAYADPGTVATHASIYIGNGQIIHCSSNGGVKISSLSSSYFSTYYLGARRIVD